MIHQKGCRRQSLQPQQSLLSVVLITLGGEYYYSIAQVVDISRIVRAQEDWAHTDTPGLQLIDACWLFFHTCHMSVIHRFKICVKHQAFTNTPG